MCKLERRKTMLEILFIVVLIIFAFIYFVPLAFSLLFAIVAILLRLWWVPFVLLLIAYILKKLL